MSKNRFTAVPVTYQASRARRAPRALCLNCDADLAGPFCHACGQAAQAHDRVSDIVREWLAAMLRADHIIWSTVTDLVLRPARLTRDWWAGKRVARMSPVRTLASLLIIGAILAWTRQLTLPGLPNDIALGVQIFAYQNALVNVLLLPILLRRMLPRDTPLTRYHHVSFALYESAFMTLLYGSLMSALLLFRLVSELTGEWILWGAYALALGALVGFLAHFAVHLRGAYGFRGRAGVLKSALIITSVSLASIAVSATLGMTGISHLWDEPGERTTASEWGWRIKAIS